MSRLAVSPLLAFLLLLVALAPAQAQGVLPAASGLASEAETRLWGTVTRTDGSAVSGFLIWDLNEATPWDVLTADLRIPEEIKELWIAHAQQDPEPRDRSIDFGGVRLTWEKEIRGYPSVQSSGLRFGHIGRIVPDGNEARVELRSGVVIEMVGSATDLGTALREIRVEPPNGAPVSFGWSEVAEVELGDPPENASPTGTRLYGTVRSRSGATFTGWASWNAARAFVEDELVGADRAVPFGQVQRLERVADDLRVRLRSGEEILLRRGGDVGSDLDLSDPRMGSVVIPWSEFASFEFGDAGAHAPTASEVAWDGGAPLRGTVRNEAGESHTGIILWDMQESSSWELLDGEHRGLELRVEFTEIARIEKLSPESAEVTLRDGRRLVIEGSNDVDDSNRGILVTPDQGDPVWMDWAGFRSVDFQLPGEGR